MPIVKINIKNTWTKEEKIELNNLIHNALVESLKIAEWDYFHRIYEFDEENFIFPEFKTNKFMIIELHLFPGRTEEAKAEMYKKICDNLLTIGIQKSDIIIQVIEQPLYNWGIAGEMKKFSK